MAIDNFSNLGVVQGSGGADINSPVFNESGKNTVKAISNAQQALSIAQKLERDDKRRDYRRAQVMGAYDGNAPYSDEALLAQGQGWAFNLSFGFMEGVVGRALAPYMKFGSDVNRLAEIEGDLPDEKMTIIREEFVRVVKDWGMWLKFYTRWILELVLQGWSIAAFPNEGDPFPVFIPQRDGWVPESSGNSPRDVDVFVWRKEYMIHELFKLIQDRKVATEAGWEVDACLKAIEGAQGKAQGNRDSGQTNWEELEKSIRDGSLSSSILGNKVIRTYHVLAPELDGTVTYWIVLNSRSEGETKLYMKEGRFENMAEFMVYADLEAGDGKFTGSKGVGQRAFNTHRAIDKFRCETLNQAYLGALAPITVDETAKQDDLQLSVIGRFLTLPPGVTIVDQSLPALPSNFEAVDNMLVNTSAERLGDVVPNAGEGVSDTKTATQAKIDQGQRLQITEANLIRFVDPLGNVTSIMIRRLCAFPTGDPYAQKFQKACLARGITPEDLAHVTGARAFGQISQVIGKQDAGIMSAFKTFRGDPAVRQHTLNEKVLEVMVGEELTDALLIPEEDKSLQLAAQRKQFDEIITMQGGLPCPVVPQDDHGPELATAIQWLGEVIKQAMAGQPNQKIVVLDAVHQHALGHLQGIASNPATKAQAQQFAKPLQEIAGAIRSLETIAKKAQATLEHAKGSPHGVPAVAPAAAPISRPVPSGNPPVVIPPAHPLTR